MDSGSIRKSRFTRWCYPILFSRLCWFQRFCLEKWFSKEHHEAQRRRHQKSKTGVSVAPQMDMCITKKKNIVYNKKKEHRDRYKIFYIELETRMHSSRMRTACLCVVSEGMGREVLWPGPAGGGESVMTWSQGGGGGRCCDLVPRGGGVVTWFRGGGRCCDLVPGGREVLWPGPSWGGVVTWSRGEGGVVTWSRRGGGRCCPQTFGVSLLPPPPHWTEWVTHACKNIAFARFATRAVIIKWSLYL